jgi:4-amino-4-deoxy-L-arabinose transferase-like glycosyltransferase
MNRNTILKTASNPIFITLLLLTINFIISAFGSMNNDEGMWNYIGRIWSHNGIPPYSGSVENKTPGIFELFAISNLLFGISTFFVRGLGIIAVLVSAFIVYKISEKLHSKLAGVFSMYLFGLTSTWGMASGIFISHTEVFMVMFSTLSFYFVLKDRDSEHWKYHLLIAGIFMGFAIAFKQIAITTTIALFLYYLYTSSIQSGQKKLPGIILICSGILISTLLSIIPLLMSGVTFREYLNGAWLILLNSNSSSSLSAHLKGFLEVFVFSRVVFFFLSIFPFTFLAT